MRRKITEDQITELMQAIPRAEEVERWRAHAARQARHIKELQEKIDAEKSCACSFDAPGDVCAAHSPALAKARAEVERLRTGLHRISLASQNSMSSKNECGRIARETLEAKP